MSSRDPRRPRPQAAEPVEERIHHRILEAMSFADLPPGTKLVEAQVAAAFGVSRERARKVLDRLVHERRLVRIVNRGVFVPKPTLAEARAFYRARRVLEAGIVGTLCLEIDAAALRQLRNHIRAEKAAHASGDSGLAMRLAGEFHFLLADKVGNPDISRYVRELVGRTRLFMALYHPAAPAECIPIEHEALVKALASRDAARAMELAQKHLLAVERRLGEGPGERGAVDLRAVLTAKH